MSAPWERYQSSAPWERYKKQPAQSIDVNGPDSYKMSGGEEFLAGIGKGFFDVGRGLGQFVGLVSEDDIKEARRLDKKLMETTGGQIGNVVGSAAALAPTALIPGANTLAGAAAIGLGSGLTAPAESLAERATNTLAGTVLAPAAIAGGRAVAAGYQGAKALAAPFSRAGQEKIAARSLQSFATDPKAAASRLSAFPGSQISKPTVAEVAGDPGLAQLQRSILNNPDAARALNQRMMDNTLSRVNALREIAGDQGQREFFDQSRRRAAEELYGKAFKDGADKAALTPALKGEVTKLLKRPSMQQAMKEAQQLALEDGVKLTDRTSIEGLHYAKKSIDDQIEQAVRAGKMKHAESLQGTQKKLLGVIEKLSPTYGEARVTFQEMSKPINQMDVGQHLLNKLEPPLAAGGQIGANKAAFGRALQNPDQVAKTATGFAGAKLDKIMSPEQMATLRALQTEFAGQANAENMGRAIGSNTAQNLVSQNFLRQVLGPTGLPQSWSESALLQTAMRPIQFAARVGEERVAPMIGDAMLDPKEAARLLLLAQRRGLLERSAPDLARYLPGLGLLALPAE